MFVKKKFQVFLFVSANAYVQAVAEMDALTVIFTPTKTDLLSTKFYILSARILKNLFRVTARLNYVVINESNPL